MGAALRPWGWAASPIVAAVGEDARFWPLLVALLVVSTASAAAWALVRAGAVPFEELARRAELRRGMFVALYVMDFRGAALLRRRAVRGVAGVRLLRLPWPRRPYLAVPWRDALWVLRSAGRVIFAVALGGGATLAALAAPESGVVVLGAVLAAYLAAAQLVEPMRAEVEASDAARRLPYRYGNLVLLHGVLPTFLLALAWIVASLVGLALGIVSAGASLLLIAACPLLVVGLVLCAAVAAQRGPTPVELLAIGDAGAALIVLWLATGPILAMVVLGVPTLILTGALVGQTVSWGTVAGTVLLFSSMVAAGALLLRRRQFPG
jgi:hypothetical protein